MKKYSYVDERGDFNGPHTVEELLQFKESKIIGDFTQILDESCKRLITLRDVLSNEPGPKTFPVTPVVVEQRTVAFPSPSRTGSCVACGGAIPAMSIQCPYCQTDVRKTELTGHTYVEAIQNRVRGIYARYPTRKGDLCEMKKCEDELSQAIAAFNMPNDKEHLFEFFTYCDGQVSATKPGVLELADDLGKEHLAWFGKARTAFLKLQIYAKDDAHILALGSTIGKRYVTGDYAAKIRFRGAMAIVWILVGIVLFGAAMIAVGKFSGLLDK